MIPCLYGYLNQKAESPQAYFIVQFLPAIFEIVFSLILAVSACYIANWVNKSTGKKHDSCLLIWHILNLFMLIALSGLWALFAI